MKAINTKARKIMLRYYLNNIINKHEAKKKIYGTKFKEYNNAKFIL